MEKRFHIPPPQSQKGPAQAGLPLYHSHLNHRSKWQPSNSPAQWYCPGQTGEPVLHPLPNMHTDCPAGIVLMELSGEEIWFSISDQPEAGGNTILPPTQDSVHGIQHWTDSKHLLERKQDLMMSCGAEPVPMRLHRLSLCQWSTVGSKASSPPTSNEVEWGGERWLMLCFPIIEHQWGPAGSWAPLLRSIVVLYVSPQLLSSLVSEGLSEESNLHIPSASVRQRKSGSQICCEDVSRGKG